ncbi:hypothetical protein ACFXJ8_26090 [Nonomuraea sp. NPDC059194]|uniref:hypothetical protein n=1 Tax=Nonomuraea sp. NPDC059194 TaxID=3346764 RepID=UPI0036AB619E
MTRYWIHSAPDDYTDEGQRLCARGDRCSDPRVELIDGKTARRPAFTYRAFCDQDRTAVAKALNDLPLLLLRVRQRLDKSFAVAGGPVVSMSKSAPVPISLSADELVRLILATLVSWEERVRTVARLAPMDTETARRRRDGAILTQAWTILAAHLDALLALPEEPMMRAVPLHEAARLPHGTTGVVHPTAGYAYVLLPLSGADAGLELLSLAYRCRGFLGDTERKARHLPGVFCYCGFAELYEVRDYDGQPAGARCRECRTEYNAEEYSDLTKARAEPVKSYRRSTLQPAGLDDHTSRRA